MNIKVYITLLLSAFFWGGSAIAGKFSLAIFFPSTVTFLRFFIAAIIILIFLKNKKQLMVIDPVMHLKMFITAIFGVTLCYYFYFKGLNSSSAFNAGIIEATIPLITLLFAALSGMEHVKAWQLIGLFIAYLGVTITITGGDLNILSVAAYHKGDILLLISTLCFGVYNVLIKRWTMPLSGMARMFYLFIYGSIAFVPWVIIDFYDFHGFIYPNMHISVISILSILFMSIGGSVLAYLFFNQGIEAIGATKAASFINVVPFITVLLSVFVLKEPAGPLKWAGAVIIMSGVMLSNRATVKQQQTICQRRHF